MALLSKASISKAPDLKSKIINIPEWGGDVKIQVMSVKEQREFVTYLDGKPSDYEMGVYLVIHSCVDENGDKIFNDSEEDFALVESKSPDVIKMLFQEIFDLNKQSPDAVEELAKNS
jgi:hypothetical protein